MKKLTFIFILTTLLSLSTAQVVFAQRNSSNLFNTNDFIGGGTNTSGTVKGDSTNTDGTVKGGPTKTDGTVKGGPSSTSGNIPSDPPEKLDDPLGESISIEGLLLKLFEIILYVGIPVVAFFLIWSGFMFISAQGNPEKIETAKSRLLYTIIGAILLLGAWTISQAIKGTIEDIKRGGTALLKKNSQSGQSAISDLIRSPDSLT